jgi:DNA-binding NarL/FixJ family response regulator
MGEADAVSVPVRVLVVDDQEPFRAVAAAVVTATPGFEVVGEAGTGEESVELAAATAPDLVLMDVMLPGIDGMTATRRIRAANPTVTVLLLSTYDSQDYAADAAACGAAAFVAKSAFGPQVLLDVIEAARAC